jgi:hypothetical protein
MEKRIKLIWDFRGPVAQQTAAHFHEHLLDSNVLGPENSAGVEHPDASHSIVYLIVSQLEMPRFRDSLKPHRGEYV